MTSINSKYPYVSITVITYNSEQTIKKCLSSVFEVDYPRDRYEVIVIDSGSTDKTLEIVKEFPVDRLIITERIPRGKGRNIGMQEAKGEIVAMIDSDHQLVNRDWLSTIVREFDDPRVAMVREDDLVPLPSKGEGIGLGKRILYFLSISPERVLIED